MDFTYLVVAAVITGLLAWGLAVVVFRGKPQFLRVRWIFQIIVWVIFLILAFIPVGE